ncbi:tail fiber protein [Bacteroides phage BF766P1]|nr:tail fiber protein [Bacteroides phage BF766P1]
MGNTKNPERQALIYITAQESGHPYIEILNGVKTKSLSGTNRTRLGDLSNIQDSAFPEGQQPSGSGLYCDNAFLRGIFLLRNGKSVEDEVNQAKQDAANATTEAERAQQTAQEAKDRLNKWADDGFISPTEKPALIDEGKRIQAEFLQIKNNADKYGVSVTEYTKAYEDYLNELRYHSAQQPEDIAVRPELAKTQTIYYDRRNGALNAIANAAKSYVDEADKKLKEYLDTEITAIPGKIELAIRSMKVADVNLLYDSNHKLNANPYQMGAYKYDVHLEAGKTYTLTVCYKCADSDVIRAYNNPSYGWIGTLPKSAEETVLSQPITPINPDGAYFYFYKFPQQESTETYIKWAVITEGSVGVANWIPSATERKLNIGGENLMLQSQQALDGSGAQYAFQLSKAWTDLKGKTLTISFDYAYSNLKMGSSQRFGLEKAIYKSGTSQYYYIGAFKYVDSTSPTADKGRYVHTIKVPEDIEDSLDTDIIAYIQLGAGSVCRINNFQIEIGDTATGWKPAPKDSFTESKKYTDTQILAVDGKIELSVKTQLEKTTIGGNNLIDGSKGYWFDQSDYRGNVSLNYNPASNGWRMSVLGSGAFNCYKQWMNVDKTVITPGKQYTLGIDVSIGGNYVHETGLFFNIRYFEGSTAKLVAYKTIVLTNDTKWTRYYVTLDLPSVLPSGITINDLFFLCGFAGNNTGTGAGLIVSYKNINLVEGGIGTSWSPSANDTFGKSVEYTNQQISIVEGKITTTVEKLTEVDGKVTGLASRVTQTEASITSVVGDINTLNNTTDRHITKQVDLTGWDNNKFFPLVIGMPVYYKAKVVINRPLDAAYGKPSYATHQDGFSMNLSFEMSGSGWGSLPAVTNIFDYTRAWSTGKIVVDLGQITESSTCVMGLRGGSKYDVTLHEDTNPAAINVYQTDYTGPYGQVFPVRTDGTEPVRTYGYYSEIKQTQESISATVAKVDDQGRRLNAAELTLTADNARIGVVENGLVNTGINITSRKIVLKSDNVLFQNNAGQQTAAINANGKLTANSIEVGEVVAGGFAAQRITTGNLTVTDGAVIGGMTITGGVLTGKNINIQDGAKIGNFTIVSGIFSAQNTPAGIQMTLSNNAATFDSSGVRVEHNSGGYALTTTGNGRVFLTGSNFWVQCKDVDFMGAQTWKAPGVFYACTILANGAIGKTWGNPDFHITRVTKNSTGRYTVNTTGSNGDYFVMITAYDPSSWLSTTVEPYSEGQFTYKVFDVNNGMRDGGVIIYFCGMVR